MPYKDPEAARAWSRAYSKKNAKRITARHKVWNEANKEEISAQRSAYHAANRDRINGKITDKRRRRKTFLLELLGGKCVRCESVEDLEFDHIDPATKEFTISNGFTFGFIRLVDEAYKCQLLCRPCHKNKTYPGATQK